MFKINVQIFFLKKKFFSKKRLKYYKKKSYRDETLLTVNFNLRTGF